MPPRKRIIHDYVDICLYLSTETMKTALQSQTQWTLRRVKGESPHGGQAKPNDFDATRHGALRTTSANLYPGFVNGTAGTISTRPSPCASGVNPYWFPKSFSMSMPVLLLYCTLIVGFGILGAISN